MTVIYRTSPSRELTVMEPRVFDEIDRFVNDVWESWTPATTGPTCWIPTDMYSNNDEFVVRAELPGFSKEDISISVDKGCLTIKSERKAVEWPKGTTVYSCERYFGECSRCITLPSRLIPVKSPPHSRMACWKSDSPRQKRLNRSKSISRSSEYTAK